jgi:hypothetical protein
MCLPIVTDFNEDGTATHSIKDLSNKRGVCDFCKNADHCYLYTKLLQGIQDVNKINLVVSSCSNSICELI